MVIYAYVQVAFQVTKEAYYDGLLDEDEFEATIAELKATFRKQLHGNGVHSQLSEAQLLHLEQDAFDPPLVPVRIFTTGPVSKIRNWG